MPVERVRAVLKMAQQPISLQSPVGDSDDTNFGDFIEDKSAENPSDMTSYSLLKDKLGDVLDSLTERERKVLELRFGLVDGYSRTLEEVGKQFKVTRERIRQIEAKALRKMRHPTRIRQLQASSTTEQIDNAQNLLKVAATARSPCRRTRHRYSPVHGRSPRLREPARRSGFPDAEIRICPHDVFRRRRARRWRLFVCWRDAQQAKPLAPHAATGVLRDDALLPVRALSSAGGRG